MGKFDGQVLTCRARELDRADAGLCRWPFSTILYFEDLAFDGLDRATIAATYDAAAAAWAAICGIAFVRVSDPDIADIVAHTGPIDGPFGVLADSELPCGASASTTLSQLFDDAEPWSQEDLSILLACITHELGHAIGLEHLPGVGALMDPVIHPGVSAPQSPDIAEARRRYGLPPVPSGVSSEL